MQTIMETTAAILTLLTPGFSKVSAISQLVTVKSRKGPANRYQSGNGGLVVAHARSLHKATPSDVNFFTRSCPQFRPSNFLTEKTVGPRVSF